MIMFSLTDGELIPTLFSGHWHMAFSGRTLLRITRRTTGNRNEDFRKHID